MPKRRHTRATNTAKAKAAERKLNDDYAAEVLAERAKPPPFYVADSKQIWPVPSESKMLYASRSPRAANGNTTTSSGLFGL